MCEFVQTISLATCASTDAAITTYTRRCIIEATTRSRSSRWFGGLGVGQLVLHKLERAVVLWWWCWKAERWNWILRAKRLVLLFVWKQILRPPPRSLNQQRQPYSLSIERILLLCAIASWIFVLWNMFVFLRTKIVFWWNSDSKERQNESQ